VRHLTYGRWLSVWGEAGVPADDAAQRREFDTVVIYDPDRLSRRMAKYVVLEDELKRAGVQLRFVTIRAGNSPEDRALQQMEAVFAELDYERIVFRMMRGKRSKAERGQVVETGVAPYGYAISGMSVAAPTRWRSTRTWRLSSGGSSETSRWRHCARCATV
jgi:DNA invertase Pin-like site-specific DNA recombinase